MRALVFAAGLGTRLRPITDSMPKALVPVAGIPMLERVILKLASSGIDSFVVNTHHFRDQIKEFLASKNNFGLKIEISEEIDYALETGGGIKHASALLGDERFLVHNVDILSNLDVKWFLDRDDKTNLATLLLTDDRSSDRYLLFDESMRLKGWINHKTGEVKSPFKDFDPAKYREFGFTGIHIISPSVFPLMSTWPEKFSIIDFYLQNAASYPILGVLANGLKIIDIGSPEKLVEANRQF